MGDYVFLSMCLSNLIFGEFFAGAYSLLAVDVDVGYPLNFIGMSRREDLLYLS